jgi:uncharacterized protein YkwD
MHQRAGTRRTRRVGVLAGALLVLALATGCYSGGASTTTRHREYPTDQSYEATTERELVDAINLTRAAHGLPGVGWDSQLGWLALDWSQTMAARDSFVHRDLNNAIRNLVSGFSRLGENILVGACNMSAFDMHWAWMNSASHRANILAPNYNRVAIGVVCGPDGRVWATTNFGTV